MLGLALGLLAPQTAPPRSVTVKHTARALQPGELVVLTIVTAQAVSQLQVRAFDQEFAPFAVDERTWKALIGIDLDVKPGSYLVAVSTPAGDVRASHSLAVVAKKFPTRRLTVDESFVNPPPEALERIQRDAEDLEKIWSSSAAERFWQDFFLRPVPDKSNSAFGKRSVFNGQPRSPHGGADFLSPSGRPIVSPSRARVALARDLYYTGNTVILDHGAGLFSIFAHLSVIKVKEDEIVTSGQALGKVGATGRVTGPHLHWAVRLNGTRIDPLALLALLGKPTAGSED